MQCLSDAICTIFLHFLKKGHFPHFIQVPVPFSIILRLTDALSKFFFLALIYVSKGGVLYLVFASQDASQDNSQLFCFKHTQLSSKAKQLRNVLGRKKQIQNLSLRLGIHTKYICISPRSTMFSCLLQVLYMTSSIWLLGVKSRDFSHAEKGRTDCKAEQIYEMTTIFTQNVPRLSF